MKGKSLDGVCDNSFSKGRGACGKSYQVSYIVVQVAIGKDTTITRVRLDILGLISTERMRVMVTRAAPLPTTQKKGEGQLLIKDDAMTYR